MLKYFVSTMSGLVSLIGILALFGETSVTGKLNAIGLLLFAVVLGLTAVCLSLYDVETE